MRVLLILCVGSIMLSACATLRKHPKAPTNATTTATTLQQQLGLKPYSPSNAVLLSAILPWLGTPYRFGGNDRAGVDCSGLIYQIFREVYAIQLPRQTSQLAAQLPPVLPEEMREGDLVFFTINTKSVGHAGIYLNDGAFIHASTSRGVIISRLSEPYWQRYFTGAARVKQTAQQP